MAKRKRNTESSTPYDDVFRTLITKSGKWIIPFINEMFHFKKPIDMNARIQYGMDEHFISGRNGKQNKIISDSVILIDDVPYHIECQSRDDGTILARIAAYDWTTAMERSHLDQNRLVIPLPYSGLFYLRKTAQTPDHLTVAYESYDGRTFEYDVKVICLMDFTLDDLIEKNLIMLLPFYLFNLEKELKKFDTDETAREEVVTSYEDLIGFLNESCDQGKISYGDYLLLTDMLKKVTDNLSKKQVKARKELDHIMGGKVLEFKGERLLKQGLKQGRVEGRVEGRKEGRVEGRKEGRVEGRKEGQTDVFLRLVHDGYLTADAAEKLAKEKYGIDEDEFRSMLASYHPDDDELLQG